MARKKERKVPTDIRKYIGTELSKYFSHARTTGGESRAAYAERVLGKNPSVVDQLINPDLHDRLADENMRRIECADLERGLSPALFSYTGLAFQHISPESLTDGQLDYLQDHLRILSGFYGAYYSYSQTFYARVGSFFRGWNTLHGCSSNQRKSGSPALRR